MRHGKRFHFDEARVIGIFLGRTNVAKDFIAARVAHGFGFGDLAPIFALADRRMVVSDLFDFAWTEQVKTRIAHMADGHDIVLDQSESEHAGHTCPLGPDTRETQNFVVREGNGFANALFRRAGGPFQPFANHVSRYTGRSLTRRVAANAIDNDINATIGIDVITVFVVPATPAGIGRGRETQLGFHRHQRLSRAAVMSAISTTVTIKTVSTMVRHISRSVILDGFPLEVDHARQTDGGAAREVRRRIAADGFAIDGCAELADIFDGENAGFRIATNTAMLAGNIGQGFELNIDPIGPAAAANDNLIFRHLERLLAFLIGITEIRKDEAFCLVGCIVLGAVNGLHTNLLLGRRFGDGGCNGGGGIDWLGLCGSGFWGMMRRVSEPAPYSAFCGAPNSE